MVCFVFFFFKIMYIYSADPYHYRIKLLFFVEFIDL